MTRQSAAPSQGQGVSKSFRYFESSSATRKPGPIYSRVIFVRQAMPAIAPIRIQSFRFPLRMNLTNTYRKTARTSWSNAS